MSDQDNFDDDIIKFEDEVEDFIVKWFGERCLDFEPNCHCCQRWRNYDELMSNPFDDGLQP